MLSTPRKAWKGSFTVVAALALAGCGSAQDVASQITLWQFGQLRLLGGSATMPLVPLGTASDGSATTYLYQALNNELITTENVAGVPTTQAIPFPTPRTIIASASGWFEPFISSSGTVTGSISCTFSNATFGGCLDTQNGTIHISANSGVPTPVVLPIAMSAIPTTYYPFSQSIPSPTMSLNGDSRHSATETLPVGAIVGCVFGGCALGLGIILFSIWQRKKLRSKSPLLPIAFYAAPQFKEAAPAALSSGKHRVYQSLGEPPMYTSSKRR